eukprot:206325_1
MLSSDEVNLCGKYEDNADYKEVKSFIQRIYEKNKKIIFPKEIIDLVLRYAQKCYYFHELNEASQLILINNDNNISIKRFYRNNEVYFCSDFNDKLYIYGTDSLGNSGMGIQFDLMKKYLDSKKM